jgi:hypothetical protein
VEGVCAWQAFWGAFSKYKILVERKIFLNSYAAVLHNISGYLERRLKSSCSQDSKFPVPRASLLTCTIFQVMTEMV